MKESIQPIILCGGNGTRLWPLSRASYPKQLLTLFNEYSLLQLTVQRFLCKNYREPIFVCNEEYRFLVAEQLRKIGLYSPTIILEPQPMDTTNAIASALHYINNREAIVIISPSDHLISNADLFLEYMSKGHYLADKNYLITFGINPTNPSVNYGYIELGKSLQQEGCYLINKFVEKPQTEIATNLLEKGCLWNSGVFMFKSGVMLEHLERLLPENYNLTQNAVENSQKDLDFVRLDAASYSKLRKISIDYGIMEKVERIAVISCPNLNWSDVGDWDSVWKTYPKDIDGNVINGDVIAQNVHNSLLYSEGVLLSAIDVENLAIIATSDAILVADRSKTQNVKDLALNMREQRRGEVDLHKRVYRPWGFYQEVDIGERFKVKRLMIKQGERTSIQIHHHRSEHWVVVSGTAKIMLGEEELTYHENESIYIPAGTKHSIENPGRIPLHIIEVQTGSYLGEDDIIRLEDKYGRQER